MKNPELTEYEMLAFEQHNQELQEEEISILQAIKDFGLDKYSRDRLEREAAKSLLELNDLVDRINLLSETQMKDTLDALGFVNGNPTGIFKIAQDKGKQQQKSEFARENALKQVAKRPPSIALKEIEDKEYPLHKHLFHLTGRVNEFVTNMHLKYPVIKNAGTIQKLVSKLNKINGIIPKSK